MADTTPVTILDVYAVDDETEDETFIGKVEYAGDGMLSVLEADAEHRTLLDNAVVSLNKKDVLAEMIAPGPNAPRFALATRVVKRTDKDFLQALQSYLLKYYGLSLG